jgi:hypothetical protein
VIPRNCELNISRLSFIPSAAGVMLIMRERAPIAEKIEA